jgi:flagellar basal-body rod modification protein FlgD
VTVDTISMGARTAGRQEFTWANTNQVADPSSYRFRVTATNQATTLATTTLMRDRVDAVNTSGNSLTLELERSGRVAYSAITAVD